MNPANEIIDIDQGQGQPGWITPEYDPAGNMISGPAPGGETARRHFVYDAWNRLRKVYADDGDGQFEPSDGQGTGDDALIAAYLYDGAKRRIEKATTAAAPGGPRAVDYYYNTNWQLLEQRAFDAFSEPVESHVYVWSPRYIDSPVLRDRYDAEGERDASARLHYLGDANFNVTALVGQVESAPSVFAWQVAERYLYDAYGRATVCDADWTVRPDGPDANPTPGDESAFGNVVLYCGYDLDSETGLYHVRHRYYHATLSTWTSRDPIAADINLYRYVRNNPVIYVDPSGLLPQPPQTGKQGLGSQICEQYIKFAIGGALLVPQLVTGPLNWFGYYYQFDDDGHVAKDTKLARREFLANLAKSLDVTANGKWWTITRSAWGSIYPHAKDRPGISEDPAIKSLVMQPSFWLGGAHDIEATGQYDVRFCPHPKMNGYTIVEIKSMAMKFRWVDDIDAHSLREYNWSTDSIAQGILEGIVGDLVFDKLLNADFWIHVNLRDLPTSDKFLLTPKGDVTGYAE